MNGEKHNAIFANEVASNIEGACDVILSDDWVGEEVYSLRVSDIQDVVEDDSIADNENSAWYKSTFAYDTEDGKTAKYNLLVYATDLDDAKQKTEMAIHSYGFIAEIRCIKKSNIDMLIK